MPFTKMIRKTPAATFSSALGASLCLLLAAAPAAAQAPMADAGHTPGVTVYGTGETIAKPDVV